MTFEGGNGSFTNNSIIFGGCDKDGGFENEFDNFTVIQTINVGSWDVRIQHVVVGKPIDFSPKLARIDPG